MCEKPKIAQLFIQLIASVWKILHVSASYSHPRERSWYLLRDAQLRISRYNIVDWRVVFSDVVRGVVK
jgi:hypothetical protein